MCSWDYLVWNGGALHKLSQYIKLPALLLVVVFVASAPLLAIGLSSSPITPAARAQAQEPLTAVEVQAAAERECTAGTASRFVACRGGFKAGITGSDTKTAKCSAANYPNSTDRTQCGRGYDAGKTLKDNGVGVVTGDILEGASPAPTGNIPESDTGCGTDFDWLICKMIRGASDTVRWIEDTVIEPFLDISPLLFTANPTYDIWKVMRDLANGMFVVVFLVFIFAQTLSLNLDAYAIRKIIPKLVAAAILVQLSYLLSSLAIDVFNVLGHGLFLLTDASIPAYIPQGFNNQAGSFLNLAVLAGAASAFAVSAAVSVSILPALIGVVLGALAVFFTLIFRQILVVLLVVTAPLAIVAWVLPSTEKLFKKWLDLFIKVLFMYPIIILLFAAGKLFAASAGATNATFAPLFALIGATIPLFIIPMSFRFAGGLVSQVGTLALKRGSAMGKKVGGSSWAKNRAEQNKEDAFIRHKDLDGEKGLKAAFSRTRARGMTGNLLPTVRNQRDLNKGYDKAEKDQIDTHTARIESDPSITTPMLVALASGSTNVKGYEQSRTMRMAAIKRLAKTNDAENLRTVRSNISTEQGNMNATQAKGLDKLYDRSISSEYGDILKIAPDLTVAPSKGLALEGIASASPERVSTFHSTTVDHLGAHGSDAQKTQFFQSVVRMGAPQRGKMDSKTIEAIEKLGNTGVIGGTFKYKDAAGNDQVGSAQDWIHHNISNGRWN